jgi:hypothetical protein
MAYPIAKRGLDMLLASFALVLLAPLLALVAACVWLEDPGAPVLFQQRRCGRDGRRFELLKFHTMVRDAEALKESLRARSVVGWPDFRLPNDPRVTRFGRFLRRTSFDELPQLVNVLRGEMSLVGPRPTSFDARHTRCSSEPFRASSGAPAWRENYRGADLTHRTAASQPRVGGFRRSTQQLHHPLSRSEPAQGLGVHRGRTQRPAVVREDRLGRAGRDERPGMGSAPPATRAAWVMNHPCGQRGTIRVEGEFTGEVTGCASRGL